jgi:glutathione synthase/RimK-type ligase-like ATP-grasp enzyme
VTKQIALATYREQPSLYPDDRLLLNELRSRGLGAEPTIWNEPSIDWGKFDAVVIRSTWDYHLHHSTFLDWVARVERTSALWNPPKVIRWNSHKSYLKDLEHQGVPIVPTEIVRPGDRLDEVMGRRGWAKAVLKPAVSANAYRTYLLRAEDREANQNKLREASEGGEALLQPYLEEVESEGERSLVFLGEEFSHAFLRLPKLAAKPQLTEGLPVQPSPGELEVARSAVHTAPARTLYARVDLVPTKEGSARIMELEMIEPLLMIGNAPGAPARFANALQEVL